MTGTLGEFDPAWWPESRTDLCSTAGLPHTRSKRSLLPHTRLEIMPPPRTVRAWHCRRRRQPTVDSSRDGGFGRRVTALVCGGSGEGESADPGPKQGVIPQAGGCASSSSTSSPSPSPSSSSSSSSSSTLTLASWVLAGPFQLMAERPRPNGTQRATRRGHFRRAHASRGAQGVSPKSCRHPWASG